MSAATLDAAKAVAEKTQNDELGKALGAVKRVPLEESNAVR